MMFYLKKNNQNKFKNNNFYQRINTNDLENIKTLYLIPLEREFIFMIIIDFIPPFRIFTNF